MLFMFPLAFVDTASNCSKLFVELMGVVEVAPRVEAAGSVSAFCDIGRSLVTVFAFALLVVPAVRPVSANLSLLLHIYCYELNVL